VHIIDPVRPSPAPAPASVERGAELLKVLASPVRLGVILELERHGTRCVHELVDALGVSQPLMSQHLRVLRAAQLVAGERAGKEIRYSITDEHVIHIVRDAIRHAEEERQ
jgi:ArsR family transcriptional regulator, zinc-responsive transcriptional repressor